MNNFIQTVKRLGASAILLLGTCLTAQAQFSPAAPVCMAHTVSPLTTSNYNYTLGAGQTFVRWEAAGEISIPNAVGTVSGSTRTTPVTSTGFGRGRLTLVVTASGCSTESSVSLDIRKSFPQSTTSAFITGPGCVEPGKPYGYIVTPPLVSSATMIAAGLADTYAWSFPAGALAVFSGDGSAVSVTMPANLTAASSPVRVTIGGCNPTTSFLESPLVVKPTAPVLTLSAGVASCKPDLTPFSFTFPVVPGTLYTWNNVPAGWNLNTPGATQSGAGYTYAVAGTATVTITISPGSALVSDVSLTASVSGTGDCSSSTSSPVRVSQQLSSAAFPITMTSGNPAVVIPAGTCLTPGTVVTFSVNTAALPANTLFAWTLPTSGWGVTASTSNSITATVGTAGGSATVRLAACGTGGSTQTIRVSGTTVTSSGGMSIACAYNFNDLGCGLYRTLRTSPSPLVSDCAPEQYFFTIVAPNGTLIASSPANTAPPQALNNISNSFQSPVPVPAGSTVRVVGTKRSNCLRMEQVLGNVAEYDPSICRGVANPGNGGAASSALTERVEVYPNPAGSVLQVNLPVKKAGTSRLTLTDALGRVVLRTTTEGSRASLDVRALPEGSYTLHTTVPGGPEKAQVVVVQH